MHHTTPTPQHRSTASHTARTPQNTPQHHNPSNWRKCTQMWQARDTTTRPISSTHNYPQHTTRALTCPADTIITPELSPYTATGVDCEVVVLSPSCAAHKASQPHHNPAHPTSRSPLRPSPQNTLAPVRMDCPPNTISLQTTPLSHTCEAAGARVSSKHSSPSRIQLW